MQIKFFLETQGGGKVRGEEKFRNKGHFRLRAARLRRDE